MPVDNADSQVIALEAKVAELHKRAQDLNKQPGREAEATIVYKELAALDDQALGLRLEAAQLPTAADVAAVASAAPEYYAALPHPQRWTSIQQRQRALGAVLGAALGDAAACSCQWVYSEPAMAALAAERPALEFYDPPQCPFFSYPLGSISPYHEQTAVLLQSLAETGGLDCAAYAAAIYAAFGPGYRGYRDRSTKSFLRRYAAGALPPHTGSEDDQANAFARLPPLVALYAGAGPGQLAAAAERMVRVTQNDPVAVAYGTAAALVLDSVIGGASVTAAVASTVEWLEQQAGKQQQQQQNPQAVRTGGLADEREKRPDGGAQNVFVTGSLWADVAARLLQAAELAPLPPLEAASRLGRNCHLPNSLQTPLQVMLHLEHRQALQQGREEALPAPAQQQAVAAAADAPAVSNGQLEGAAADSSDECLPCSMGACTLPLWRDQEVGAAGRDLLAVTVQRQQELGEAGTLPAEAFVQAVRLAIRPGGCCASRAGFVGALAGALGLPLPEDWPGRVLQYDQIQQHAQQLMQLRD